MTATTIENYQERAARTMATLGNNAVDGAHMALGVTTELLEMDKGFLANDRVNVREEHGDTYWYIANECNIYGLSFSKLVEKANNIGLTTTIKDFNLEDLVDLHKRELAYGKEMVINALENQLVLLIRKLDNVTLAFDFSLEDSLSRNIEKLFTRYPGKFTQENALNRDLEAEHETLK